MQILKAMGLHFTAAVAGEVLRATGAWGLHEQAGLLRSDLSPVFPPAFEVCTLSAWGRGQGVV